MTTMPTPEPKEIIMKNGSRILVDAADYPILSAMKWHLAHARNGRTYVMGYRDTGKPKKDKYPLHRLLLQPEEGKVVDHINGDPLDNRRCNLRIVDHSSNCYNKATETEKRGVFVTKNGRYKVRFRFAGRQMFCYGFTSIDEAAAYYDDVMVRLRGSVALTNNQHPLGGMTAKERLRSTEAINERRSREGA